MNSLKFSCILLAVSTIGTAADQSPQPRVVTPGAAASQPPSDAIVLFDGHDLSHWTRKDGSPPRCTVEEAAMVCRTGSGDLYSQEKFQDAQIHLEFRIPSMPDQHGQLRGNSGVLIHGVYEVQILDSYNNPTYANGACGAYYGHKAPLVNASRPPEEWQSYDIVFHGPKCDAGDRLVQPGSLTVIQNGVLVQDHVPIETRRTCKDRIGEPGPVVLQDHQPKNPPMTAMRFRNVWMRNLDVSAALAMPSGYKGKPFQDEFHKSGPQVIPGTLQCALYDLGGEGVAYHDSDEVNQGAKLNHTEFLRGKDKVLTKHCRPGTPEYICFFRENEGVDISYTKDFADFSHPNLFDPPKEQLYVGWEEEGEWTNYTVSVKSAGTYKITALYGNADNVIKFDVDNKPDSECKLPIATGSPHKWNKAEIGEITFAEPGLHLLTLHYGKGNNLAYLEFAYAAGRAVLHRQPLPAWLSCRAGNSCQIEPGRRGPAAD